MTVDSAFEVLNRTDEYGLQWARNRAAARAQLDSFGGESVFSWISANLERRFKEAGNLKVDESELRKHVEQAFGRDLFEPYHELVHELCLAGGLAFFLDISDPSKDRLEAVATSELRHDQRFMIERIVAGKHRGAWLELLRNAEGETAAINGDELLAMDEKKRWSERVIEPVPEWHYGNFPHHGTEFLGLISELLRTLDEPTWIEFMNTRDLPMVVEALLWHTGVDREPELLLRWIEAAPPAFDSQGLRTPSFLVFVFERAILGRLEDYVMRHARWDSSAEDRTKVIDALTPCTEALGATLRKRLDSSHLLAELAARCMRRASTEPESETARARHSLYWSLANTYVKALGSPEHVVSVCADRALVLAKRSRFSLWLAATAGPYELLEHDRAEADRLLRKLWSWLLALLTERDSGIAERYAKPAHWTARFAGLALAAMEDPAAEFEKAWSLLAPQRLDRTRDIYADDPWSTSRFLTRLGFHAYLDKANDDAAFALWRKAMEIAISAWFGNTSLNSFAEVAYGMATLGARKRPVPGEPARTLRHLRGEPEKVALCTTNLCANGYTVEEVADAARDAGFDLREYLSLDRYSSTKEASARLLRTLLEGRPDSC